MSVPPGPSKPPASSSQDSKRPNQTERAFVILNIQPSYSSQSDQIDRHSSSSSAARNASALISHPSDPETPPTRASRPLSVRPGQLLYLYSPASRYRIQGNSPTVPWSGIVDHVARFHSQEGQPTPNIVAPSAASSVRTEAENQSLDSTLLEDETTATDTWSGGITPSLAGGAERVPVSSLISSTTQLAVSISESPSSLDVPDKQLENISTQVDQLTVASQGALHAVNIELERNRAEVAQTRREVYAAGKQIVQVSQLGTLIQFACSPTAPI